MGGSPGNHPLPPPPPDGGDKGGTTKPATAGCGEVESQPMGARRKGCHRALGTPNLTHTPPSRSVPYQSNFLSYDLKCPGPKHPIPPTGSEATNIGSALSQDPSRSRVGSAAPHPSPLTVPTHPARSLPGRCSADIRAGRPAGGGGGRGEGACGRGSKGTLGSGQRRGIVKPTLLASSLLRSIRARVRDSIRDIIPRWGVAGGALGTQASSYCGGGGNGLPSTRRSGDRKSDSPRGTRASSSNPSLHPPAQAQEGGGGAEQGGYPRD